LGSVGWATAWTASKHDPSDTVRNDRPPPALESRRVRTQPLTVTVEPTGWVVRAHSPTKTLAVLASWAVERGMELDELRVSRPSLEDTYLELIR